MKTKRVLALLLAGAMTISMAACGDSSSSGSTATTTDSAAEETAADDSADTAAAEDTAEETADADAGSSGGDSDFTWNGQTEMWEILPTTGVPGLKWNADFAGERMKELGWTYVAKDAQGDPTNQVNFVEDAIAAGNVGALMIAAMDTDMLEEVCEKAKEAGIAVSMLGVTPSYEIAGAVATQYSLTGLFAVDAAEDWVEKRVAEGGDIPTNADGKYEVAVDTYYDITDGIYRSNAMVGAINESDILVGVSNTTSYGDSAQEDAYNNANAVLTANPDCRIFIAYEPDNAIGINSYIEDYASQNGLSLEDFCVIPCYAADDTFLAMYAEADADHSANSIKGYATYGGSVSEEELAECVEISGSEDWASCYATGRALATIMLGVCGYDSDGYSWTYGDIYWDDVNAANVYGFTEHYQAGDANPAEQYQIDTVISLE